MLEYRSTDSRKSSSADASAESSMDGAGFGEGADPNNGPEGGVIDGSVEPIGIVRASTKSSGETGTRGTAWLARSSRGRRCGRWRVLGRREITHCWLRYASGRSRAATGASRNSLPRVKCRACAPGRNGVKRRILDGENVKKEGSIGTRKVETTGGRLQEHG